MEGRRANEEVICPQREEPQREEERGHLQNHSGAEEVLMHIVRTVTRSFALSHSSDNGDDRLNFGGCEAVHWGGIMAKDYKDLGRVETLKTTAEVLEDLKRALYADAQAQACVKSCQQHNFGWCLRC
ncbi:hypothetical protein Esti_003101 [Eimeria stiedai]